MKKLKGIKGILIGIFVVAAACCVFMACSSDSESTGDNGAGGETIYTPIDSSSITGMTLDYSNVKRTYLTYQSFSSEGLSATATRESGATEIMSASDLDIDYSAFDSATAGKYTIKVSYVENEYSFTGTYDVEVIEEIVGLTVTKTRVDYVIGDNDGDGSVDEENTATTVTISLDDLAVYAVEASEATSESETDYYDEDGGNADSALDSGEYELKFFRGGEEISSLENVGAGIYTIYAYRSVDIVGEFSTMKYECGAYVLVYVVDAPTSIEFIEEGSTTSQIISAADEMTGTWRFTVGYESGNTAIVDSSKVDIANLDTLSLPEDNSTEVKGTASVTYAESYITSTEHQTKTVEMDVEYTIETPEGVEIIKNSSDFEALRDLAVGEENIKNGNSNADLKSEYFTDDNAFIQYIGEEGTDNDQRSRYQSSTCIIETKGDILAVTFKGTGKITVEFSSTGGSNNSNLGLKNESGYYLKGEGQTETDASLTEYELPDDEGYVYEVVGTTHKEISFIVNEPGTYIISTNVAVDGKTPGRTTRIKSISQIDVVYGEETLSALSLESEKEAKLSEGIDFSENACDLDFKDIELALPENLALTCGVNASKKDNTNK